MSDANVFSPATTPVFNPAPVRGHRKVYVPATAEPPPPPPPVTVGLAELPPFSLGGVIRVSADYGLMTNIYPVKDAVTVTELAVTLAQLDVEYGSPDPDSGPKFRVVSNNTTIFTSERITQTFTSIPVSLSLGAGALVSILIPPDNFGEFAGNGESAGLTVVMRL